MTINKDVLNRRGEDSTATDAVLPDSTAPGTTAPPDSTAGNTAAAPKPPKARAAAPPKPDNAELEALKVQNAKLMQIVMEMQAKLMPDPEQKKVAESRLFNKKAHFIKYRGDGGVFYEQNGRKYNGKFELQAE